MTIPAILGRAATLVALLAAGAAHGGEAVARAPRGSLSEPAAATTASVSVSERPRVTAGVLLRATSRRSQKREASAAREGPATGARPADGTIESIEIDWNGSGSTP